MDEGVRSYLQHPIEVGVVLFPGTEVENPSLLVSNLQLEVVEVTEEVCDKVRGEIRFKWRISPGVVRTRVVRAPNRKSVALAVNPPGSSRGGAGKPTPAALVRYPLPRSR